MKPTNGHGDCPATENMPDNPEISVVVPLFDEEESVERLVRSVRAAMGKADPWELILVDDGSRDATFERARREATADSRVRVVRLARNYGQTMAMQAGFDSARGGIVVSMDGDLQNDPEDIPRLVAKLREGFDLVAGYRESRRDRFVTRKIPSWLANRLIAAITRVPIRDNGCTLKAFRREVLRDLHMYSDMHRFIPALVAATTSSRIAQIPVRHHPRRFGRSKYGLTRVWKVLADLLTMTMIRWFRERPLLMFSWGTAAASSVGLGFLAATLFVQATFRPVKAAAIVFPGSTFLWFGLAGYLFVVGLIAEIAVREARRVA